MSKFDDVKFSYIGWKHYLEWFKSGEKKSLNKINELIEDIKKNGELKGKGHPERLKHFNQELYSREISKGDRLVYYPESESVLVIVSCRGHYNDK